MPTRHTASEMRLVLLTSVACPCIMRIKYSLTHAARLYFVANCIDTELRYEELREYFSCVREVLVVEVVSFS